MSTDENTASSPAQTGIPKERLDEVLARERQARDEVAFLRGQLQQVAPKNKPQVAEPAWLREKRETNPQEYAYFKNQERLVQQAQVAAAESIDLSDRTSFVAKVGKNADKYLQQVEQLIAAERARGNFSMSRESAYIFLKGNEALRNEYQTQKPGEVIKTVQKDTEEVPSTNPANQGIVNKGTASVSDEPSLDELFNRIKDNPL